MDKGKKKYKFKKIKESQLKNLKSIEIKFYTIISILFQMHFLF